MSHYLIWEPGKATFKTYRGSLDDNPGADALIDSWVYAGDDVQEPGAENFRFNFWLMGGLPPRNGKGHEIVIGDFVHTPGRGADARRTRSLPAAWRV